MTCTPLHLRGSSEISLGQIKLTKRNYSTATDILTYFFVIAHNYSQYYVQCTNFEISFKAV